MGGLVWVCGGEGDGGEDECLSEGLWGYCGGGDEGGEDGKGWVSKKQGMDEHG